MFTCVIFLAASEPVRLVLPRPRCGPLAYRLRRVPVRPPPGPEGFAISPGLVLLRAGFSTCWVGPPARGLPAALAVRGHYEHITRYVTSVRSARHAAAAARARRPPKKSVSRPQRKAPQANQGARSDGAWGANPLAFRFLWLVGPAQHGKRCKRFRRHCGSLGVCARCA